MDHRNKERLSESEHNITEKLSGLKSTNWKVIQKQYRLKLSEDRKKFSEATVTAKTVLGEQELTKLVPLRRLIHLEPRRNQKKLPDPWDLMTGKELWQALQYAKGNTDPFGHIPQKRTSGTKECPNIVRSIYDKRLVGCICDPESSQIVYFWVHEGFPRRCNCNHWFVLERIDPPKLYEDCD